ncbi:MAG: hypothetical protein C6P37_08025 [Caldibacillus debilis]|uniref:Uncharacterized protein n=1 Tax=Caldibacillus debilis TaxID=301148 RepID=A0A3E0K4K4_9BACI|nr:hypothetical protein [Bacillaceae bacterium]OUM91864.1 MAG: hypothetical protein BAA03_08445 [Caldibacillus debilis]REJ28582.1 MAG: hypothetical protein C6P37_08025 [Caldibacillus debilis]
MRKKLGKIFVNGRQVEGKRLANPYREAGLRVPFAQLEPLLQEGGITIEIWFAETAGRPCRAEFSPARFACPFLAERVLFSRPARGFRKTVPGRLAGGGKGGQVQPAEKLR